jgi:hypothetical protein
MLPFEFQLGCRASPLPAAVASISPIAIPVSAPASPASSPSTESATPTSATTAPSALRGTRFVNDDLPAHKILAVESLDRTIGLFVAIDLDESEPAWLA